MIKSIYRNVKSCVKDASSMSYSDFFDVSLGLKQGEPLSPLLFILFINDIKTTLNLNEMSDDDIDMLSFWLGATAPSLCIVFGYVCSLDAGRCNAKAGYKCTKMLRVRRLVESYMLTVR